MDDATSRSRESLVVSDTETSDKPLPHDRCLNCGREPLDTAYCPECGQENLHRPAPLRQIFGDVLEEFLKWDGRLFRTLFLLIFKPGQLTRAYNDGQRIRYLSPFKMYFVVSALFFALLSAQVRPEISHFKFAEINEPVNFFDGKKYLRGQVREKYEQEQKDPDNKKRDTGATYFVKRGVAGLIDSPNEFITNAMENTTKVMVLLLPVYAGLLAALYWRHKRYFVEHLVFAAHIQTFAFFLATAIDLLARATDSPLVLLLIFVYVFYEFKALRICYGSGFFSTWFKQQVLVLLYLFALSMVLALTAFTTILTG